MTQAPPDRLDRLESSVERLVEVVTAMDKKLNVHIAKTDERFNAVDQRFKVLDDNLSELKAEVAAKFSDLGTDVKEVRNEVKSQESRLWGFVVALFLSLAGVLAKVVFFPQA